MDMKRPRRMARPKKAGFRTELPGGKLVVLASNERFCGFDSHRSVAAIGVCANGLAELFVQGRATDKHDVVIADAFLDHRVDHDLHVGHGCGQKGGHTKDVRLFGFDRFKIVLDRVVDTQIDDFKTGTFHHHRHKVLADVVDVAFDGADDHLADTWCAGFGQKRLEDRHATLHRVRSQKYLWHKQDAVSEVISDDGHTAHKRFGQDIIRFPTALQQDVHGLFDLFLETVIEIVEHLLDQFLVIEIREDDIVFFVSHVCHSRRERGRSRLFYRLIVVLRLSHLVKSDMRGNATDAPEAGTLRKRGWVARVLLSFYISRMRQPDRPVLRDQRPGRGAQSRDTGRFERLRRVDEDDGWDLPEGAEPIRTHVSEERPRSLINYVTSPDLSFDRTINPYRGCEHGCIYCFARPTHAWLGLSPGLDFETRLVARPDAPQVLERELRASRYHVAPIAIGTNTDPYQPIERDRKIMRACLGVLRDFGHPVMIATKGTLIERDIDILSMMATRKLVRVGVTITTLDPDLNRRMEPRVPSPSRRLETIRRLTQAGIPVRVMVSPIVPGLTDPEIEPILTAARDAGATAATWAMLRLPLEVAPLWEEWLDEHYPARKSRILSKLREMHGGKVYDAQFFKRVRGEGAYASLIAQRFTKARKRLWLDGDLPPLDCTAYCPPPRAGDQLSLF